MSNEADNIDWGLILESLHFTRMRFQEYQHYPSYDYKRQRIAEVERVIEQIKQYRRVNK